MEILGFIIAFIIGLLLGLTGGGGSVITLPVMVYLLGISPLKAVTYSLFVVGVSSFSGTLFYLKKKMVDLKMGIVFLIPSLIAVFLTRKFLLPLIPQEILDFRGFILTKDVLVMVLFALLMLFICFQMFFRESPSNERGTEQNVDYIKVVAEASLVGVITGVVGIGGGFLIIPSLVNLFGFPMKQAVGTSLFIVCANSCIGFLADTGEHLNWDFLFLFSAIAIAGMLAGGFISRFVSGNRLKQAFGMLVFFVGVFILLKEVHVFNIL